MWTFSQAGTHASSHMAAQSKWFPGSTFITAQTIGVQGTWICASHVAKLNCMTWFSRNVASLCLLHRTCHLFCFHSIALHIVEAIKAPILRSCDWCTTMRTTGSFKVKWEACVCVGVSGNMNLVRDSLIKPLKFRAFTFTRECRGINFVSDMQILLICWFSSVDAELVCHLICCFYFRMAAVLPKWLGVILPRTFRWSISPLLSVWKEARGWLAALQTFAWGGVPGIPSRCNQEPTGEFHQEPQGSRISSTFPSKNWWKSRRDFSVTF